MKARIICLLGTIAVLAIMGCSGSKTYRGTWKATDADGKKVEITFDAKSFTVKDSAGQITTYDYKQNSVQVKNSIKSYGIVLSDGRNYTIYFPYSNDDSIALIIDGQGNTIYIISRNDYKEFDEAYKLK